MKDLQEKSKQFSHLIDGAAVQLVTYLENVAKIKIKSPITLYQGETLDFGDYIKIQAEIMISIAKALQQGFKSIEGEVSRNKIITNMFLCKQLSASCF